MSKDLEVLWPGWETARVIGRGSFGTVYEIERDVFGQKEKAALKVITIPQSTSDIDELRSNGYDDASITDTFKSYLKNIVDEYSLMRKLNGSANVVNCDDVRYVQHDDGYGWDIFIKMELLTPLTKALGKTTSDEQVIQIGKDICKALNLCKKHNIVHRDIKPANIFVSENGDYKLGDFGIAKTVEKTSGGTKIGTYEYMAPEVYHDEPYGSSADIYSLGLVLYWLLNERRTPFLPLPPQLPTNSDRDLARKKRFRGEAIPAPAHGSKELQEIVLKACAYKPEDRYLSANDFLCALNKIGTKDSTSVEDSTLETANNESEDAGTGTTGVFYTEKSRNKSNREKAITEITEGILNEDGTRTEDAFHVSRKIENTDNNSVTPPPQPPKKYWHIIEAIACIIVVFSLIQKWNHDQNTEITTSPSSAVVSVPQTISPTPTMKQYSTSIPVASPKVVKVYAGNGYTIGLYNDGTVKYAGSTYGKRELQEIAGWTDIEELFISQDLVVGRKKNGSYISNAGKIVLPGELSSLEFGIGAEYEFLTSDGKLYHTSTNFDSQVELVEENGTIKFVPIDQPDTIILLDDEKDHLGLEYPEWSDLKGIEIGSDSAFGLRTDGTVITCPKMYKNSDRFLAVESWKSISAISMGFGYVPVGLKNDGTVVTVPNNYGVNQDTSSWKSVKKICAEGNITIGLRNDGKVYATGGEYEAADYISEVEKWTDIVDIALSNNHVVGVKMDGTLVAVGNNENGQCNLSAW